MSPNGVGIASIIISIIGLLGGWLAARESRKASTTNTSATGRVEMEKEAYERARTYDKDTIERQTKELKELRANQVNINNDVKFVHDENERLHEENERVLDDNARLRAELAQLRRRFTLYQRGLPEDTTAPIREREGDTNPMIERFQNDRE